jgi:hypothetical protein
VEIIEKVHLKFLKFIASLKSSTPSCMVDGESGRYPLSISINIRMTMYWAKITTAVRNKPTNAIYCYL